MTSVLVNALGLPSFRQGGAGFYAATLIDGLSRRDDVTSAAIVGPALRDELTLLAPAARAVVAQERSLAAPLKALNYARAIRQPALLDTGHTAALPRAEVVHWPISFLHGPPPARGVRRVLTILDLQHEFFPAFFSARDRMLRRMRWAPSARAADHLIAISEFTKTTACERYGVDEARVTVVPLWCRRAFLDAAPPDDGALPPAVRGRRYVVYPASPLPAKNHARLLEAFARHAARTDSDLRLVLTGPRLHSWAPVEAAIARHGMAERVVLLGHVDDAGLRAVYANAAGLVFPSLFEGFGLPVAEAMATGCPVACSTAASLPEVAGSAARLFDPADTDAIADAIAWLDGLEGEERRRTIAAGAAQAATFTPDRLVARTVETYERAAA